MADPTTKETVRFEEALHELEETVQRLESGELSLEEALTAFERGVALVRLLNGKLAEVEERVEVLTRDRDGKLRTRPLDPDQE